MEAAHNAREPRFGGIDSPSRLLRPAHPDDVFASASDPAVAILDQHGVVAYCSASVGELLKRDSRELIGREASHLFPELPLNKQTPGYNLAFAAFWGSAVVWLEVEGLTPEGRFVPLEASLKRISLDGCPFIMLGLRPQDADTHLNGQLSRLEASAETSLDAIMISDTDGIIRYVNPAFEQMTGYSRDEAVGQPASLLKSGFHDAVFYEKLWSALRLGQDFRALFANRRKNGEVFFEEKHIRPFIGENGSIVSYVASGRIVSDTLQETLLRLQHQAYHDALTGLPNRNLFMDRLGQALSRATRHNEGFAVVYIDLDDFKEINDRHGHAAGDTVLCATARCLVSCIRDEDTAARLGGDEFALILLDAARHKDVEIVLEKILATLAHGACHRDAESDGEAQIPIRASIGACLFPLDGRDGQTLMCHADSAMYRQKSTHGHGFHFYSETDPPRSEIQARRQ